MTTKVTKGLTLNELAAEITRQNEAKYDFTADTRHLTVEPDSNSPTNLTLKAGSTDRFPIKLHAIRQMGTQLAIPATFVDRLAAEYPDMLAWNINQLFQREPSVRLVRVLFNDVRAYLSNTYRPLDNYDFANVTLDELYKANAVLLASEVTENRLFIKGIIPGIEREVKKPGTFRGDGGHNLISTFKPAINMGNSETGASSQYFETGNWQKECSNMMVFGTYSMRKYHIGKALADSAEVQALYSTATKEAADRAHWLKVRDLVKAALSVELFNKLVDEVEAKMTGKEMVNPVSAIKALPNLTLTENEQDGILATLIKGGDLSQFGMQAALTRFAQSESVSFERQVELERAGGAIIELPKTDWSVLAEAA